MTVYVLIEHLCGAETVLCIATSVAICKREADEHKFVKPYIEEHTPMEWYEGKLTKPYIYYTANDYFRIYEVQVMSA